MVGNIDVVVKQRTSLSALWKSNVKMFYFCSYSHHSSPSCRSSVVISRNKFSNNKKDALYSSCFGNLRLRATVEENEFTNTSLGITSDVFVVTWFCLTSSQILKPEHISDHIIYQLVQCLLLSFVL